jgi:hypothetical protein
LGIFLVMNFCNPTAQKLIFISIWISSSL